MTEADIVELHQVWPEGQRDQGLMLHQAPYSIILQLAAHRWDSVALREMIGAELGSRIKTVEDSIGGNERGRTS